VTAIDVAARLAHRGRGYLVRQDEHARMNDKIIFFGPGSRRTITRIYAVDRG
jgi:hypothetical protein